MNTQQQVENTAENTVKKQELDNQTKNPKSGMDLYGPQRLELAIYVRDQILPKLDIPWTIEGGTLLGAYRTGKFIVHDDDFDIAFFFDTDCKPIMKETLKKIQDLLPNHLEARLIDTYTDKLEIYDPSYGKYPLPGRGSDDVTYHHVTVDLQAYQKIGNEYVSQYHKCLHVPRINEKYVQPFGQITLEGEKFNAPQDTMKSLEAMYGSISAKAKYNKIKGIYELQEEKLS